MKNTVLQRFLLLLEHGGLEELRLPLERLEAERPNYAIYPCLLAWLDCELGHQRQAQARLDVLARDSFSAVQRDHAWLMAITLLANVAATVGNPQQIKTLYELLLPYSALVAGSDHIRIGSVSRYLGILAAALSRLDEAADLLRDAVEANDRIDARPWSAHAKIDLARVLSARDAPRDPEAAGDLLGSALATYQELGMTVAAAKVAAEQQPTRG